MRWIAGWLERTTDERKVRMLRDRQRRVEKSWNEATQLALNCSHVLMALEAAETFLDQDVSSGGKRVRRVIQSSVQRSISRSATDCERYINVAPSAKLVWTEQCMIRALGACRQLMCRPDANPQYQMLNGEPVPVCGAQDYMLKALKPPSAEEVYSGKSDTWDPDKWANAMRGKDDAASDDW